MLNVGEGVEKNQRLKAGRERKAPGRWCGREGVKASLRKVDIEGWKRVGAAGQLACGEALLVRYRVEFCASKRARITDERDGGKGKLNDGEGFLL